MPTGYQSLEKRWKIKGNRKPYGESHTACDSNGSCKRGHLSLYGHANWSRAIEASSAMLIKHPIPSWAFSI